MTTDTNVLSYWWNWRFLICAVLLSSLMIAATVLIWKYEGCKKSRRERRRRRRNQPELVGSLYEDEAWTTSLKTIHPAWLLAYRTFAFIALLSLIVANIVVSGAGILYFYTQWTFCLVTIYFGLGSSLSIYGCYRNRNRVDEDADDHVKDEEQGTYVPPTLEGNEDVSNISKSTVEAYPTRKSAGVFVYLFQIIFQVCGGAVVLTDAVFWLILYPFLTDKSYKLNFLMVSMHSFNVVFLLGDTILNNLRFPMFRISYFVLWTGTFVICQWIIHACKNMWWPYPFLDLASSYAPLWYVGVGVMQIPCYCVFALIIKLKQLWFSRSFPDSFQGERSH